MIYSKSDASVCQWLPIYHIIQSAQDHVLLQDTLMAWADLWLIQFNISKCKILQVSLHNKSVYPYKMNGITLQTVENYSYLARCTIEP